MKALWIVTLLGLGNLTGCGAQPTTTDGDNAEGVAVAHEDLLGGTASFARPAIGLMGGCTATLVDPSFVVTAAHCFGGQSGPVNVSFSTWNTAGTALPAVTVNYGFAVGPETTSAGADDLAIGRLATPITTITPVPFGLVLPAAGATVTAWGFGCTERVNQTGGGVKRYRTYTYPNSDANCPIDSGGPRTYGTVGSGNIWGINSGYFLNGAGDIEVDATLYGYATLNAVRTFGVPGQIKATLSDFATWAGTAGVRAVSGDFNADGKTDIALTGVSGWGSIPVAFGDGNGSYTVTNSGVANFPGWAPLARSIVTGDFDGDGDTDIALVGNSAWSTIPVAFSNRNGSFTVSNLGTPSIPGLGAAPGAYALAGDFDADGDADIALIGGQTWTTIPIAFSSRNGAFTFSNSSVSNFPAWAQTANARGVVGDFDGDGDADLALTGVPGWTTIPTALSNRNGAFTVINNGVLGFPGIAAPEVKYTAGDFDGDGRADILATGGVGWSNNIYFAKGELNGVYTYWILPLPNIPDLSQRASFVLAGRNSGRAHSNIMLLGEGLPYIMSVLL